MMKLINKEWVKDVKLENDIPLPIEHAGRGALKRLISSAKVGDSFVVPKHIDDAIYIIAKRVGIKVTGRVLHTGEKRFWRTE